MFTSPVLQKHTKSFKILESEAEKEMQQAERALYLYIHGPI